MKVYGMQKGGNLSNYWLKRFYVTFPTCCESLSFLFPQQQAKHPVGNSLLVGEGGKLTELRLFLLDIPTPLNGRSMSINSRS